MKKKLLTMAVCTAMVMGLSACSSQSAETTAAPAAEATTAAEKSEATEAAAESKKETEAAKSEAASDATYAMILKTQATDFWVKMWNGIEDKAEELGVKVDLYAAQSEQDLEGQLAIVENAVNQGYTGIGVAPLSSVNVLPAIGQATQKGITVINVDAKFDEAELANQGGSVVGFVSTDNVAVGNKGAQFIVDKLEKGAQVAVIEGKSGDQSSEDRTNGATKAFEDGGMEIIGSQSADWDRQIAMDVVSTYIQQYPELKGIYCCNDGMALGAMQAVINADKVGEILVVGTDGDKEAVQSVKDGQLSATVAQDPAKIGATSLELLVKAVEEGNKGEVGIFPETTPVESVVIDSSNAADFLAE